MAEGDVPETNPGTEGYPSDTPRYPESNSEGDVPAGESLGIDLSVYLDPREVARTNMITSDQPLAHLGLAGWAVERASGRAVWLSGETQWDVMKREYGAPRDEPGLSDVPANGGLPTAPARDDASLEAEAREVAKAEYEAHRAAKRVQIGLKLSLEDAYLLEDAAAEFGLSRTTMARLLVVRGAREITRNAGGGGDPQD